MKKLFALVALVLGVVSCQKDHAGMDVNMGGEQEVMINVSLPEETRSDSALGAFGNVDFTEYDVRFQCEVHYKGEKKSLEPQYSDNGKTATFPVRLIPGRNYTFVVWADLVEEDTTADLHYNTAAGLSAITLKDTWIAMDDTRDAYTCSEVHKFTGTSNISLTLKRPFAKLRVKTTDMEELLGVDPAKAKVTYTTKHYDTFNAFEQAPENKNLSKTHDTFAIVEYTENEGENKKTLFTDYFFAKADQEVVNFTLEVFEANEAPIITRTFTTDIPVKRNYLTTIEGDILTYGDNITVEIKPEFANAGNIEEAPYYQAAVSNGFDLVKALYEGREIIVLNDITVTAADVEAYLATRAATAINPVLNLNGKTITFVNNGTDALITIPYGSSLTIIDGDDEENKGTIVVDGAGAAIENNGTINIDGVAIEIGDNAPEGTKAIENKGTAIIYNTEIEEGAIENSEEAIIGNYVYTANDLVEALEEGKNVFFANDIKIEPASMSNAYGTTGINIKNGQTINGNGFTLNIQGAGGTWDSGICTTGGLIKNLKVTGSFRGIFVKGGNHTEKVVLENVTLEGVTYTISVDQANGQGIEATNCTFNGWTSYAATIGEVKFTDCSFGEGNGYAFCRPYAPTTFVRCEFSKGYEVDARGVSTFDNCTLNGVAVTAENIATLVTGNIANAKLPGVEGTFVSTGDQLVAALENNATVILANDIEMEAKQSSGYGKAGVVVTPGKTINGNGKTLKVTNAGSTWDCAICAKGGTIKNLTIAQGFRGIFMPGATGDVFIENVTFDGPTYTFNSDAGNKNYGVYLSNCTIKGWTSHSDVHKEVVYTNCEFGERGYKFCRPYGPTTFVDCNFCEGYKIDARGKVNFANCTLNGVALTNENLNTLVEGTTNTQFTDAEGNLLVSTADELVAALEANKSVAFANDIKIEPASMSNAYGTTGINIKNGQTINGNGFTLNIQGAGGTWDSGINTTGGVIKNLTVTGSFRGIFINHTSEHSEKVVLENVTIGGNGTVYTISCDQGLYQGIEATNCTFNGWTSFAKTAGEAKFINCSFGEGSTYKYCRPYSNTEFVGCTFCPGYAVDTTRATITFTDCTWKE